MFLTTAAVRHRIGPIRFTSVSPLPHVSAPTAAAALLVDIDTMFWPVALQRIVPQEMFHNFSFCRLWAVMEKYDSLMLCGSTAVKLRGTSSEDSSRVPKRPRISHAEGPPIDAQMLGCALLLLGLTRPTKKDSTFSEITS